MYRAELHLHIDGSLREETMMELLDKKDIHNLITITDSDKTLKDYLKKFDLPLSVLQNRENLKRVSYELVEDLYKEETLYAELRLAPIQHMKLDLTGSDVIEAALDGIESFTKDHPITVKLFTEATSRGIPFTIHSGEARGADSVFEAIILGAKQIGHGIRSHTDMRVLQIIKGNNVCLEFCPTSNIQTGIFKNLSSYPLKTFIDHNIPFTINSDNRTVSGTTCLKEEKLLKESFSLSDEQIKQTYINAIKYSFSDKTEKERLLNIIRSQYGVK